MARQFDGSSQYFQSTANLDLSSAGTGPITVAFWLWWDAYANADLLAMELSPNFNSNVGFLIDPDSSSAVFTFGHSNGSGGYRVSKFIRRSAAVWHHYMLVMATDSTANNVAYADGSSVGLTTVLNDGGTAWTAQPLYGMSRSGTSLFGAGRMAGLGIWAGTLTAGDATTLAGGAAPSTVGSPLYAWNLCGVASPEPYSVGGIDLTLGASPPQVADPAAFAAVCGSGRRFLLVRR